jgi:hypothetical protein
MACTVHHIRGACQAPEILIANTDAMFAHRVTVHSFFLSFFLFLFTGMCILPVSQQMASCSGLAYLSSQSTFSKLFYTIPNFGWLGSIANNIVHMG